MNKKFNIKQLAKVKKEAEKKSIGINKRRLALTNKKIATLFKTLTPLWIL
jgi:hypothetical protein